MRITYLTRRSVREAQAVALTNMGSVGCCRPQAPNPPALFNLSICKHTIHIPTKSIACQSIEKRMIMALSRRLAKRVWQIKCFYLEWQKELRKPQTVRLQESLACAFLACYTQQTHSCPPILCLQQKLQKTAIYDKILKEVQCKASHLHQKNETEHVFFGSGF